MSYEQCYTCAHLYGELFSLGDKTTKAASDITPALFPLRFQPSALFAISLTLSFELYHQTPSLAFVLKICYMEIMNKKEILSEIQYIVDQIVRRYNPLKIILFGSAARGEYENVNDLDFLIIKQDVPLYGLDRMRELDELIDRNIAADMLVYRPDEFEERTQLGDPFIKMILKEGRVLHG